MEIVTFTKNIFFADLDPIDDASEVVMTNNDWPKYFSLRREAEDPDKKKVQFLKNRLRSPDSSDAERDVLAQPAPSLLR